MKSPSNYLIAVLALTTIGGAALAWHQYQELAELRAAALNKDERADWQKRVWDLEKANRELTDQLAAMHTDGGDPDAVVAAATGDQPARGQGGGRGGRGGRGQNTAQQQALQALFAKPEVQAMLEQQRKAAIADRYGALIKGLNLSPDQADKLKTLLAERQTSLQDVFAAGREQGLDRDGMRKLADSTREDINNNIKALIGDSGFAQLQNFDQTGPQRAVADRVNREIVNAGGQPMSDSQYNSLVGVLAANAPARAQNQNGGGDQGGRGFGGGGFAGGGFGGGGPGGGGFGGRGGDIGALAGAFFGGGGGGGSTITPAAVSQAQGILSSSQMTALQQVQQQQQQTQQLRQLVNDTMAANQPQTKAGNGTTGGTGTNGTGGGRRRGGGGGD